MNRTLAMGVGILILLGTSALPVAAQTQVPPTVGVTISAEPNTIELPPAEAPLPTVVVTGTFRLEDVHAGTIKVEVDLSLAIEPIQFVSFDPSPALTNCTFQIHRYEVCDWVGPSVGDEVSLVFSFAVVPVTPSGVFAFGADAVDANSTSLGDATTTMTILPAQTPVVAPPIELPPAFTG